MVTTNFYKAYEESSNLFNFKSIGLGHVFDAFSEVILCQCRYFDNFQFAVYGLITFVETILP